MSDLTSPPSEHARLERALAESQLRIRRLEMLNDIQQQVMVCSSVPQLEAVAFSYLPALMPLAAGSLLLLDATTACAEVVEAHLRPMHAPAGIQLADGHALGDLPVAIWPEDWPGMTNLQAGQPWLANDLAGLPPFTGQQALLAAGLRAVLNVPLMLDERLVGALCLSADDAQVYQPEHVQVAQDVAGTIARVVQQVRLIELERERRREYEMIHALTQVMRGALTQVELYALFLPEAIKLLDAQGGAVFVPSAAGELECVLVADGGLGNCDTVHPDLLQAMRQVSEQREIQFLPGLNCSLLPLQAGSQLFSILAFSWARPLLANVRAHTLLRTISELLSIALTRLSARETLEQKVNQRTRELMSLYEITRLYVSSEDIQTLAESSLSVVLNTLHARAGLIHLVNTPGPSVNVVAHLGLDSGLLADALDFEAESHQWKRIIQSGSPLLIRNLPGREDLPRAIALSGYQSFLASPIRANKVTLGAISLFYQDGEVLSVEDLNLVDLIADQLGIVIERSQLRQKASAAAILEERHRLARELHDSVTQSLYSLSFMADALRSLAEQQQWGRIQSQLTFMQESAQQALKEMRLLVYELVPASLEEQGLATVIRQRLNYVEKRAGMETDLVIEGDLDLAVDVQMGVYRIAQEALNNVIKHAYAKRVQVILRSRPPGLWLQVKDDGVGFDMEKLAAGMGLRNMLERAAQLGGQLTIESHPEAGTCVVFSVDEEAV